MTREELEGIVASGTDMQVFAEDYEIIMKAIDLYTSDLQKDNEILVNTILTEKDKRIEELEKALRNISGLDSAIDLGLQV